MRAADLEITIKPEIVLCGLFVLRVCALPSDVPPRLPPLDTICDDRRLPAPDAGDGMGVQAF